MEDGPDHLRGTFARHGVTSRRIFDDEQHGLSDWGAIARRMLFLKFLEHTLAP
ncbi:MAG: hypothetical protein WD771_09365 [Gemmatimonadaceae bacterium]